MKRNLLIAFSFLACMMIITSCNESLSDLEPTEKTVSFSITMENGISSRSYGDGKGTTRLRYVVFDAENNCVKFDSVSSLTNNYSLNISLNVGSDYTVAFWADNPTINCYKFDAINGVVEINYNKAIANDDRRDAFTASQRITVTENTTSIKVKLSRPFAQLNIAASDLAGSLYADSELESEIEMFLPSTFNLINRTVSQTSYYDMKKVIFTRSAIPSDNESKPKVLENFSYLSMNYIPCSKDGSVNDVTFRLFKKDATTEITERQFRNINFKPNYRTNVGTSLLTTNVTFIIDIEPNFESDNDDNIIDPINPDEPQNPDEPDNKTYKDTDKKIYYVNSIETLREALSTDSDVAKGGWTVKLTTDLNLMNTTIEPISVNKEATDIILDGGNHSISNFALSTVKITEGGSERPISSLLYASVDAITNLMIKDIDVNQVNIGNDADNKPSRCAAIAAYFTGTMTNVSVSDITINSSWMGGGLIAQIPDTGYNTNISDCSAENINITAGPSSGYMGGIIGHISVMERPTTIMISECAVANCTLNDEPSNLNGKKGLIVGGAPQTCMDDIKSSTPKLTIKIHGSKISGNNSTSNLFGGFDNSYSKIFE